MEKIFKQIDAQADKYADFLKDICNYETKSEDKPALDALADYIQAYAEKEGFCVERTPFEKCGDFLTIDLNPGAEKSCVLMAHMDTVHPKGRFGNPPVTIDGDQLIGPGAVDCKGGIAVAMSMMRALADNGYDKHVRLLLTSDEEISNSLGGEKEQAFFREKPQGFQYVLNCEVAEDNQVVVSRSGILRFRIDIEGKGGHSGVHYFNCKNPIKEAAHKIIALEENSRKGLTYSCNVIQGGNAVNVIPGTCTMFVDVRVNRVADIAVAQQTVAQVAETSFLGGTTATVTQLSIRPPMEKKPETLALFDKLQAVSQKYALGELTPEESGGGADSAYTQMAGITSICGVGSIGKYYHTEKEYTLLSSIQTRAKLLAAFLCEM